MIEIVRAEPEHGKAIANALREHERFEFNLLDLDPGKELENQIKGSEAYVALVDGQPACLWGFRDHVLSGTHLWMVTTGLVEKYPKKFLRESRKVIRRALKSHPMIYGYVDAKFGVSCTWMEWLGFEPVNQVQFKDLVLIRYEVRG